MSEDLPHVDHTCPDIDRVGAVIHRHVETGSPDWEEAMEMLEKLRRDNLQLRNNALHFEREADIANRKFLQVLHQLTAFPQRAWA